jgi:hypothetical protein
LEGDGVQSTERRGSPQHNAIEKFARAAPRAFVRYIGGSHLFFLGPSAKPLRCSSIIYAAAEPGSRQSFTKAARSYARAAFLWKSVRVALWRELFRNFFCLQPQQDFMLRVSVRLGKAPLIQSQIFQVDELFHNNPP